MEQTNLTKAEVKELQETAQIQALDSQELDQIDLLVGIRVAEQALTIAQRDYSKLKAQRNRMRGINDRRRTKMAEHRIDLPEPPVVDEEAEALERDAEQAFGEWGQLVPWDQEEEPKITGGLMPNPPPPGDYSV